MSVLLKSGEYLWSSQGHHVCDENGFAVVCKEDTEVSFDSPEIEKKVLEIVKAQREILGLDHETGLPKPAEESDAQPA